MQQRDAFHQFAVDPRIRYPSYKSMDEFIDTGRLVALDSYITSRIRKRLEGGNDLQFYTGPYKLDEQSLARPGTKMIYLTQSERPDSYFDLDKTELWHPTDEAREFALLMDFIRTMPFKSTGRMLILYDHALREVPAHRDHMEPEVCHDFIWFRTNKKKPLYMLNHLTGEKTHVESYSAWFDSVNQFHGSEGHDGLSFSIRVDGIFSDSFKEKIPAPPYNAASTPSFWVALSKS
jgi:hypothetical protein